MSDFAGCWRAASAVFHESPRIVLAAVKFFLGQDESSEDSDDEDDGREDKAVNPTRAEIYNAKKKVRAACLLHLQNTGLLPRFGA